MATALFTPVYIKQIKPSNFKLLLQYNAPIRYFSTQNGSPSSSSEPKSNSNVKPNSSAQSTSSIPKTSKKPTPNVHDVFIIGGGVSGTSLLYSLAKFTDLSSICLVERRDDFAKVASAANNNSQTIHCGDIETNYGPDKAATVKCAADMLRNYATKLPLTLRDKSIAKFPKMVLGVGDVESDFLEKRFPVFKEIFPKMQLFGKKQIAEVEPRVALTNSHSLRPETMAAIYVPDEYTAVNYYELSKTFIMQAIEVNDKTVNVHLNTEVKHIEHESENNFVITTNRGVHTARYVVVSACGHSLLMAHKMGYGLNYSCLPVAGSFYFTPKLLNGKVYTVQDPALPFAAVHGDPDVIAEGKTRFGPTALPLPLLERYNLSTFTDFLQVLKPDASLLKVYWDLMKVSKLRTYVLRNFLFELPYFSTRLFLKDASKIVPSLKLEDLSYADGFGGVRPQLVDKHRRKLILGEGKIDSGKGIIFNITPSPGGTTCLQTSRADMQKICSSLGATVDEQLYRKTLLEGEYPIAKTS